MAPELQVRCLGRLGLWCVEAPGATARELPLPATLKAQSLLAYLLVHRNRQQSRDHLAGLFWGDRPEHNARRSLTTALWHIRRCLLGEDFLLADFHSAWINPRAGFWLDVTEFESLAAGPELSGLQSAVALYRGDFLDGFYDDWVLDERYRLEMLFSEALVQLMMGLEAAGDPQGALAEALHLLQLDPLREDAHRLVMRARCRLGQRNASLKQYRHCREVLRQELGAEPMEETTGLYQAIMAGRFEIGVAPDAATPAAPTAAYSPARNPLDPAARNPLVGRDAELAFLLERHREAQAGRGGLVLVRGEAGVGKTRLLEELAGRLRWQGGPVLWGRCYEFERILPYQPVCEALRAAISTMSPGELTGLAPWVLGELARLAPELSEKLPGLAPGPGAIEEQEQAHLFEGVARFLASLAAGGVLALILEDIHWATASTLQMLHYLVRHLAGHPVLVAATVRPEALGPQPALGALERQLDREGLLAPLALAGLTPEAVETLLAGMSGAGEAVAPLARLLYRETEGNPFFLAESVKALFETGSVSLEGGAWKGDFAAIAAAGLPLPAGVSEAIRARARRLEESARQALRVAAVLGREFDFDLLCAAWNKDEETTLEALEALVRRRFVDEGSGALGRDYAFHHHKIQEVVYAGMPLRRRQRLHARAGKAMERLSGSNAAAVAGELARHFGQGRHVDGALAPEVVRYLLLAGDQARLACAHGEAVGYYSEALALQEERGEFVEAGRTLMKLGLAHHTQFDFAQAHRAFEEGFARWQEAGRHEPRLSPPAPHALRIRWRSPYTLDPALCADYVSSPVVQQLFSGLVAATVDLDVVPEVARSWQVLDGGRRYRFHLRPDARWSDGTRVTAHDFEYAWKRVLASAVPGIAPELLMIRGARAFRQGESAGPSQVGICARDDATLEVALEEPVSQFLYVLTCANACPVPKRVVEAHGAAWTEVGNIVTNGPFRLQDWERGECLRLARSPWYAGHRQGNVEQVVLNFPRDASTQDLSAPLEQYLRGDLDVLTLMDASTRAGDRIRRQYAAEYLSAPWLFTIFLGFVVSRAPVDDVRLRQAMALATDREALANVVLRGMFTPGAGGLVPPGMPGHTPGLGFPYDPGRARQLLTAAGHGAGRGLPVLEALSVPPIDPEITRFLEAQWREHLGIRVAWDVADWPLFTGKLQQDPPHLYILADFADWPDPSCFLEPDIERGRTRWAGRAYEELVEQAMHVPDQEVRLGLLRQAEQVLMHEAPVVPLFYGRQHLLLKPWVSSFPVSALNRWYWKDAIIEPH